MALASMESEDGMTVTLKDLRTYLKTSEWADLDDKESELAKFLLSDVFKREGCKKK